MQALWLFALQKAIDVYWAQDAQARRDLSALSGKILRIELLPSGQRVSFVIQPDGNVHCVSPEDAGLPDVSVRCAGLELLQSFLSGVSSESGLLDVQGDVSVLEDFWRLTRQVRWDPEELLSRCSSDFIAHHLVKQCIRGLGFAREATSGISEQVREYLQLESGCLPSAAEMEAFIEEVFQLRYDVDRLEAKLNRVVARWAESS